MYIITEDMYERIEFYISGVPEKRKGLEDILYIAQTELGYLPLKMQKFISEKTEISLNEIQHCIKNTENLKGDEETAIVISVCTGRNCDGRGSNFILEEFEKQLEISVGEKTKDGKFRLEKQNCFAKCGVGPNVFVDNKHYSHVKPEQVKIILKEIQ